jgi:hypothetical protein
VEGESRRKKKTQRQVADTNKPLRERERERERESVCVCVCNLFVLFCFCVMRMRLPWRDRCQHVPFVGIEVVVAVWILLL